jgi:hypothetical protein
MQSARIVKPKESLEVQQLETPKPNIIMWNKTTSISNNNDSSNKEEEEEEQ